jgi:hypothetical protein
MTEQSNRLPSEEYSRLTVIGEAFRQYASGRRRMWVVQCVCGTKKTVFATDVKRGLTRSCGCLHREMLQKEKTTHGRTGTPEYVAWAHIIQRCENPNNKSYGTYGGNGVRVCKDWRESFDQFFADMGERPSTEHSIDRIDPTGDYEPVNCRWLLNSKQSANRRTNIYVEHNGQRLCLADYCRAVGLSYKTASYRRNVLGWPLSRTIQVADGRQ